LNGAEPAVAEESFEADPASVGRARRFVSRVLAELEIASDLAVLLTSELATNAVIHAGTAYVVGIHSAGDGVTVSVTDRSFGRPARRHYSGTSGTGRGLGLVEDLATAWGVDTVVDGKRVWFHLDGEALSGDRGDTAAEPTPDDETTLDVLIAELGLDIDDGVNQSSRPPIAA